MKFDNIFTDDPSSKSFAAGSVIFEMGTKGEEMYVIKEGEVDILIEAVISRPFLGMIFSGNSA
jgi:CRP-like cAMP-binding protein